MIIAALVLGAGLAAGAAEPPFVHLRFGEGEGATARSEGDAGLEALLHDCAWAKRGVHDRAVEFDGEKSWIEFPADPRLDFPNGFTWSIWYKTDRPRQRFSLFTRGGYGIGWCTSISGSYVQLMGRGNDTALKYVNLPSGTAPADPWIHLVITGTKTADAGPEIRFYLNGRRISEALPLKLPLRTPGKVPFAIGRFSAAEAGWFKGLVDEIRLWDRPLCDDEIAADHAETAKPQPGDDDIETVTLRKVDFGPLRKTRVAVFSPAAVIAGRHPLPRAADWFVREAAARGCRAEAIGEAELTDPARFNAARYDTLVLAGSDMPFEAEDTVFEFLARGGCLVTRTVMPATYRLHPDGTYDGFRQHSRGWYAPFLLREEPAPHLLRKRTGRLALGAGVVPLTGELLPAVIPPAPDRSFRPLNRWDKTPTFEGGYGDPANYALAADELLPVYSDADGIGSDFAVYRYHNALLNGATLVQFGSVGAELLKGEDGAKAFEAMLRLLEAKLPGSQDDAYYALMVKVQKDWSDFVMEFGGNLRELSDAAGFAHALGGEWKLFTGAIAEAEKRRAELASVRSRQEKLLWSGGEAARIRELAEKLLAGIADCRAAAGKPLAAARRLNARAKTPSRPAVRHRYGTLPSVASSVFPMNLNRVRRRLFRTIRNIGSNVWSGSLDKWFCEDPAVRKELDGFSRDFKFLYAAEALATVGGGRYNPTDGKVTEGEIRPWPVEAIRRQVAERIADCEWMGTNRLFRIGTGDESCLGLVFWDSHAEAEFREWLKRVYGGDVAKMNAEMMSDYADFAAVRLPLRQPVTPREHALWENWRRCREDRLLGVYDTFYGIVKDICPSLDVFTLPSYGAFSSPLFACNYFEIANRCDSYAMDGTCCGDDLEWCYADVSGKRYLTSEWGGLYQESTLQYVRSKLWQELCAGSYGFEQHIWSWGGEGVNYADILDLPTAYGGILKNVLDDARRFDWLFLDGERAVPEVLVLYSQTSRMHDQGWGYGGAPRISPHVQTVCNYHRFFLGWGHSARVIDEGRMLRDGIPAGVKAMVVPQALYLDERVQRCLLDFAKAGGTLVLEGRCGQYSPFGAASDLMFRETGLLPFASAKPVAAACGAGRVVFLGSDAGRDKTADFQARLEGVLRGEGGLGERFACSDDKLFLREWTHDGGHYLTLVSRTGTPGIDWGEHEVEIAVRGRVGIRDWLSGTELKGGYRDGYTVFRTLAVAGGRVLALSCPPAMPNAEALKRPAKFAAAKAAKGGPANSAKTVKLPFDGHFFDDTPLTDGRYVFTLSTIAQGTDRHLGETYLTVTGSGESLKKRIVERTPTWFPMRGATYRVTSRDNFCMYPYYADALIERVEAVPPAAKATVKTLAGGELEMKSDFLELRFDPKEGARMTRLLLANERYDELAHDRAWAVSGQMPGPYRRVAFAVETSRIKAGAKSVFRQKDPSMGLSLVQTAALADDKAELYLSFAARNVSGSELRNELHYHPELTLGSSADALDRFTVPLGDRTVYDSPFRALSRGAGYRPGADWAAITDSGERLTLVARFDPAALQDVYIYEASDFYTLELETPVRTLKNGEELKLDFRYQFFRGLTGVDAVGGDFAAHAVVGGRLNQLRPFEAGLEIASSRRDLKPLTAGGALVRDGRTVLRLDARGDADVAFDRSARYRLSGDTASLADGEYTLEAKIEVGGRTLAISRKLEFTGNRAKALLAKIEKLKAGAGGFAAKVALFNAEKAAAAGDVAEAERLLASLAE